MATFCILSLPYNIENLKQMMDHFSLSEDDFFFVGEKSRISQIDKESLPKNIFLVEKEGLDFEDFFAKENVSHVMSFAELGLLEAADLRRKYFKEEGGYQAELNTVDKYLMREALTKRSLSSVKFLKTSLKYVKKDYLTFEGRLAIIKPTNLTGSIGVQLIKNEDSLSSYIDSIKTNKYISDDTEFLLEEYVPGEEFSIEGIYFNKNIYIYGVCEKTTTNAPYFVEIGHRFNPNHYLIKKFKDFFKEVLDCLGVVSCPFHIEFKVLNDRAEIIEVHTRYGGDFITKLIEYSCGSKVFLDYVECISKGEVHFDEKKVREGKTINIRFVHSAMGVIKKLNFDSEVILSNSILESKILVEEGAKVEPQTGFFDRVAYFIYEDDKNLDEALKKFSVELEIPYQNDEGVPSFIITDDSSNVINKLSKLYPYSKKYEHHLGKVINSLPITSKEDLLNFNVLNQDSILKKSILFSETSGTTNTPLQTPRGNSDFLWNSANLETAFTNNLKAGRDRVAIIHPGVLSPFIEASTKALQNAQIGYVKLFPISGICGYDRIYNCLLKYEVTSIMTTPSLALKIFYEIKKFHSIEELPIHSLLLTGEMITKGLANNFNKIFGRPVKTIPFVYGGSETATLMYGKEGGAYIPFLKDFLFELKNDYIPKKISANRYETSGELLVTWLNEGILPIVRYKTGDIFRVEYSLNEEGEMYDIVFIPIGREQESRETQSLFNAIREEVLNSKMSIFNYIIHIHTKTKKIKVGIVSIDEDIQEVQKLENSIYKLVNQVFSVTVSLENDTAFHRFDAAPKTKNFLLTND